MVKRMIFRRQVMTKFMLVCVAAAGFCGQFAMASAAPMNGPAPVFPTADPTTESTQDAPYQVTKLQSEVKMLQDQVRTLSNQDQAQSDESIATLESIGVGG
jgi:hypothetical protein